MASTSDIKNGLCIKFNNDIYKIIEFLHVKPGKGPAFVRTKLRSLTNGKVLDNTFSAGHKIDEVRVENHKFQFLYPEGEDFHFMNTETFEQITLNRNILDSPDLRIYVMIFSDDNKEERMNETGSIFSGNRLSL